jgi:HAD superfamily phosphoserine phosphatase-like hydrolase
MKFDTVVFDVDSTLVSIEGLDYLASLKGKEQDISGRTRKAMNGEITMREAMIEKMAIISPSISDLVKMGEAYVKNIVVGVPETINILKHNDISVWIVTGNFQPGVGILAKYLDIRPENVVTNTITHKPEGAFLSFDPNHPLSNSGGKKVMIEKYKAQLGRICFIGDGSTDLDTQDVVDRFIGFGGVVRRPHIEDKSNFYVSDPDMRSILKFVVQ